MEPLATISMKMHFDEMENFLQNERSTKGVFKLVKISPSFAPSNRSLKTARWSEKEKLKYIFFSKFFSAELQSTWDRKQFHLNFSMMSLFIKTRNPNQCRIFHRQMMKFFCGVGEMLAYYFGKVKELARYCQQHQSVL